MRAIFGEETATLRHDDASDDGWADVIDTLSMYPDVRRKVVRLLAEIHARGGDAGVTAASVRVTPCKRRSGNQRQS